MNPCREKEKGKRIKIHTTVLQFHGNNMLWNREALVGTGYLVFQVSWQYKGDLTQKPLPPPAITISQHCP